MASERAIAAAEAVVGALEAGQQVPAILESFRAFLHEAVLAFNADYSPRSLIRFATDVLPTHPRHVSAVRARMGTIIELALAERWNELIRGTGRPDWRVTVNYVTEYPDLYLRDVDGEVRARIETKTVHDEADEGAARFDTVTPLIDPSADILVVAGWRWERVRVRRKQLMYPHIVASDAFCASDICVERDTRFRITGGVFKAAGRPFVRARGGGFVADPGNYGKLNRIIHRTRRLEDLSEEVRRLSVLWNTIFPKKSRES